MGRTMKRVLVLQLCRFGDIIQTTPMLRGLRREHPDAEITLVVHDAFAAAPVPSRLYDRLVAFPQTSFVLGLAQEPLAWAEIAQRVWQWVADLGATPFDLVVNLTHTDLSCLLTSVIAARRIVGVTFLMWPVPAAALLVGASGNTASAPVASGGMRGLVGRVRRSGVARCHVGDD
jgi:ADP-heptose:LPS heptosyltransferase